MISPNFPYKSAVSRAIQIFMLAALVLPTLFLVGCASRAYIPAKEVKLKNPLMSRPGLISPGGAHAWEGCLKGNYFHSYTISTGIYAGDVWLCCVPINELLKDSFHCGAESSLLPLGGTDDIKVQTCSLLDPVSSDTHYIPACIRAPQSVDPDPPMTREDKEFNR